MKTLLDLITQLKNSKFTKISVLTGAGVSVNAGIPDFRSNKGLYSSLANPELIFDIDHFRKNPQDFYNFAPKIIIPKADPTITHYFISFLEHKQMLNICFSQNIDGLERKAGVTKIVQAHGNTEKAHCSVCYKSCERSKVLEAMMESKPIYCSCGGPLKPDVVFFGEQLPYEFFENQKKLLYSDLLIVLGTSLVVQPFSSLVGRVLDVPRVVINKERLKSFEESGLDFSRKDLLIIGDTDEILKKVIRETGWEKEFSSRYQVKLQ